MDEYDIFSDEEFLVDCEADQIMWESNICSLCHSKHKDRESMIHCSCADMGQLRQCLY